MNNIFENAYFGKAYKTRDGRKAIYLADVTNDRSDLHRTYVEGADRGENYLYVHSSGRVLKDVQNALDIVSEWQEPLGEEKLDKLAEEFCDKEYGNPTDVNKSQSGLELGYANLINCFKAGYHIAWKYLINNK